MDCYELSPKELKKRCDLEQFDFETTEEIKPAIEIIGQDRAVEAINFGLEIKKEGYNIFTLNFSGIKELAYITSLIEDKACQEEIPDDLCYVYNFNNPDQPLALRLPAGLGKEFKRDMEEFIDKVEKDIIQLFSTKEYSKKKRKLKSKYQKRSTQLINEVEDKVQDLGYALEQERSGFAIIPLNEDGSPMSEKEYNQLSSEVQEEIDKNTEMIQEMVDEAFNKIEILNDDYQQELEELNYKIVTEVIIPHYEPLYQKYCELNKVTNYLEEVKDDILQNLDEFKEDNQDNGSLLILGEEESKVDISVRYQVNLLVDNSQLDGAPVVFEQNPTYYNLTGRVEYKNEAGNLITDFSQIKSGALHRANGGYLILEAKDMLTNFKSWQLLKRVLKSGELRMENLGGEYEKIPLATLQPGVIPLNLKVIMVGSPNIYYLLHEYDDDFKELFKIKADFEENMKRTKENSHKLVQFISQECYEKELRPLNRQAVGKVIEHAARRAGGQKKLSTKFSIITNLLCEADMWAQLAKKEVITEKEIEKAIEEKINRSAKYEDNLQELYQEDKILLQTSGNKIGEVNGLSVLDIGDYAFGRPAKITAVVYQGNKGVVNIERETKMSGKIHNKGLLILAAYLGDNYAQNMPLSLSASLCFEQLYSGIDGDSASSTELYALLSALAQVPIRQDLAVTGSINQKGEIQPVGGVTEKIEGFFKVCQSRGLTGEQGVLIPVQNVDDLMLADEIVEAVEEGQFHIYAVSRVEEGIEILTGKKAGKKRKDGSYPSGTINYLIQQRIKDWAKHDNDK